MKFYQFTYIDGSIYLISKYSPLFSPSEHLLTEYLQPLLSFLFPPTSASSVIVVVVCLLSLLLLQTSSSPAFYLYIFLHQSWYLKTRQTLVKQDFFSFLRVAACSIKQPRRRERKKETGAVAAASASGPARHSFIGPAVDSVGVAAAAAFCHGRCWMYK